MWFLIGTLVVVFFFIFWSMPEYKSVFDILKDYGVDPNHIRLDYKERHTITTTGGALLLLAMFFLAVTISVLITLWVLK